MGRFKEGESRHAHSEMIDDVQNIILVLRKSFYSDKTYDALLDLLYSKAKRLRNKTLVGHFIEEIKHIDFLFLTSKISKKVATKYLLTIEDSIHYHSRLHILF
jgi:hypothetical protein